MLYEGYGRHCMRINSSLGLINADIMKGTTVIYQSLIDGKVK